MKTLKLIEDHLYFQFMKNIGQEKLKVLEDYLELNKKSGEIKMSIRSSSAEYICGWEDGIKEATEDRHDEIIRLNEIITKRTNDIVRLRSELNKLTGSINSNLDAKAVFRNKWHEEL